MRSPEMKSCLFLAVLLLAASGCGTEQSTRELASTPDLVSAPPSILTPAPSPAAAPTSTPEPTRTPTSEPIARDTPKPTTTSSPTITARWYGLVVAPENRCSPYDLDDYRYSRTVEERIVAEMGGIIYGPYTGTYFSSTKETDIEHIVARSEAHDSGAYTASSLGAADGGAHHLAPASIARPLRLGMAPA